MQCVAGGRLEGRVAVGVQHRVHRRVGVAQDDGGDDGHPVGPPGEQGDRVADVDREPAGGEEGDDSPEPLGHAQLLEEDAVVGGAGRGDAVTARSVDLRRVDAAEVAAHRLEDGDVEDEDEDEGGEDTAEEVEVDHVAQVDDGREGAAVVERDDGRVPAGERHQPHDERPDPRRSDDDRRHVPVKVLVVAEREADGDEPLDGDRQQAEDGDLREDDDDGVHREAAVEVTRDAAEGRDRAWKADRADEEVGEREARHKVVGDGAQVALPGEHDENEAVGEDGEDAGEHLEEDVDDGDGRVGRGRTDGRVDGCVDGTLVDVTRIEDTVISEVRR